MWPVRSVLQNMKVLDRGTIRVKIYWTDLESLVKLDGPNKFIIRKAYIWKPFWDYRYRKSSCFHVYFNPMKHLRQKIIG